MVVVVVVVVVVGSGVWKLGYVALKLRAEKSVTIRKSMVFDVSK